MMEYESNIWFVNSQSKGNGGHHDLCRIAHLGGVEFRLGRGGYTAVIRSGRDFMIF